LGDPAKIDINVVTTDSDNHTYDSLSDGHFFMSTSWGSSKTLMILKVIQERAGRILILKRLLL